jgi:hypothetical protein
MEDPQLSGLFVQPLATRVNDWLDAGKLDEGDLDRVLTPDARSIVDSLTVSTNWVPIRDVEGLVYLIAEQVGGGTGLVEWAETIVNAWEVDERLVSILDRASGLVDAAGYIVAQSSECLIRDADWRFEGGRERFEVRLRGLEAASSDLKTLLGALLSRLAEKGQCGFEDLRFHGVDSAELCIFAERELSPSGAESSESRLHRAALIG